MIVTCGDTECQYYNPAGCTAPVIDHTVDRFCTIGRKKRIEDYEWMMRPDAGICYRNTAAWGIKIRGL
jgi:hypothetical protein